MRHVISVLMANEAGALVRVAGMFSQRGFNIETLNVGPTEDETMSRLTLATEGTDAVVDQINRQLLKLVDVIDVLDMSGDEHIERELALVKVRMTENVQALMTQYDVTAVSEADGLTTLRFLGAGDELNQLVHGLENEQALVELSRSGAVTITPGAAGLRFRDPANEYRQTKA